MPNTFRRQKLVEDEKPSVSPPAPSKPSTRTPANPAKTPTNQKSAEQPENPPVIGAQPGPRKAQRIARPPSSESPSKTEPLESTRGEENAMDGRERVKDSTSKVAEQSGEGIKNSKSKEEALGNEAKEAGSVASASRGSEASVLLQKKQPAWEEKVAGSDLKAPQIDASKTSASNAARKEEAEKEKEEGNRLFKQKDISGALKHYSRAIEFQPGNAAFYGNRAMCYLQLRDYQGVVGDATRAIEIDPGYTKAYYRRALGRKGLEQYGEALEDLKVVQEKLPQDKQVTEEVLAITDLYMRGLKSSKASPDPTPISPESPLGTVSPPSESETLPSPSLAVPPKPTDTNGGVDLPQPSIPPKTVLPSWLKEQLAEQVKQGGLKSEATPHQQTPQKGEEKEAAARGVVRKVGSLTDEVFEGNSSTFESNLGTAAFSMGSFDKKAESPKSSSPSGFRKRPSPRSIVSTPAEAVTPPNEMDEETLPEKTAKTSEEQEAPRGVRFEAKRAGNEESIPAKAAKSSEDEETSSGVRLTVKETHEVKPVAFKGWEEIRGGEEIPLPLRPRSALEFERACSSLREPQRIAAFLQTVDPASYPSIIKENLSAVLMTHIAAALPSLPAKAVADILSGLAAVSRFALVWMLLPPATKKQFVAAIEQIPLDDDSPELSMKLKKAYKA